MFVNANSKNIKVAGLKDLTIVKQLLNMRMLKQVIKNPIIFVVICLELYITNQENKGECTHYRVKDKKWFNMLAEYLKRQELQLKL